MKFFKLFSITLAAITLFALFVSFESKSLGQAPASKTDTVKPTILATDSRPTTGSKALARFAEAAALNAALQDELQWTFGNKQQHGWRIYNSLIHQALNSQVDAGANEFASALAAWQTKKGLDPSGVLDEASLMAMISDWQNDRLKNKVYAEPDQLLTAPSSDFYDPERLEELRQVERETYAAYKKMVAAAIADPSLHLAHTDRGELAATEKFFKIVSAFRSREYQEKLRRQSPNAGSAGLALNSPHFTGRALDVYVGGDPVDTKDSNRLTQVQTPLYQWLVRNAPRFGFRPYFYEPWHWEYVK